MNTGRETSTSFQLTAEPPGRDPNCPDCGDSAPPDVVSANIADLIAFRTHELATAPSRGPMDVVGTTSRTREGTGRCACQSPR